MIAPMQKVAVLCARGAGIEPLQQLQAIGLVWITKLSQLKF